MLKIRLKRAGGRNHPFYRVVVIDSRKARDSRALEEIGYYNPIEKPFVINVDRERVAYWKERGAHVSTALKSLLRRENSVHPTRRMAEDFVPEPVEEPAAKPKKKPAKAKEEAAVATEEPLASGETAPVTETEGAGAEPAGKAKAADEKGPAVEEKPRAEKKAAAGKEPETQKKAKAVKTKAAEAATEAKPAKKAAKKTAKKPAAKAAKAAAAKTGKTGGGASESDPKGSKKAAEKKGPAGSPES